MRAGRLQPRGSWDLPAAPQAEGLLSFGPPFPNGCNTSHGGTGRSAAESGEHRGKFEVNLAAAGGEHAWAVASPCLDFRSPVDGVARCKMMLVVQGIARGSQADAGEGLVAFGPWLAHCHPKDKGCYAQKTAQKARDFAGHIAWAGVAVRHSADFPVRAGVDYKFGAGLWAACAATGDSATAVRLWGRLAYFTVEFVEKP